MRLRFSVFGEPKPQGSKKVVPIYRDGKPVMKDGRALSRAVDDNPKTAVWRQEVARAGRTAFIMAWAEQCIAEPSLLTDPVYLTLSFSRPRPKSHYGTGKNAGKLKASAPKYPTQRPDTLKLARAVEDALTGVVWRDDSQVTCHQLFKAFGPCFCVAVEIVTLDNELSVADCMTMKAAPAAGGES